MIWEGKKKIQFAAELISSACVCMYFNLMDGWTTGSIAKELDSVFQILHTHKHTSLFMKWGVKTLLWGSGNDWSWFQFAEHFPLSKMENLKILEWAVEVTAGWCLNPALLDEDEVRPMFTLRTPCVNPFSPGFHQFCSHTQANVGSCPGIRFRRRHYEIINTMG